MRGLGILGVVFVHGLASVVFGNEAGLVAGFNPALIICLAPVALLFTWAPMFAMISGTANAYVMHGAMLRYEREGGAKSPLNDLLARGVVNSVSLYVLSILNMTFLHHSMEFNGAFRHTLLTSSLQHGEIAPFSLQLLFYNDALALIATSGLVTTVTLWLLWRGGGFQRVRRNFVALGLMAACWMAVSPWLHHRLDGVFYNALDNNAYLLAFGLKSVIGPNQAPFPNVAFGLCGALFGLALARQVEPGRIRRTGYAASALCLTAGVTIIAFQGVRVEELVQHTFPIKLHLLNLGIMLAVTTVVVDKIECGPQARREAFARWTVFLRRAGAVTLTIFLLEGVVAVTIGRAFIYMAGTESFPRQAVFVVPFLLSLWVFWDVALRQWERWHFRFGFEWLVVGINAMLRGRRSLRLNPAYVLKGAPGRRTL